MNRKNKIDRNKIRFNVDHEIHYKFHNKVIKCNLMNISETGILLKTNQVFVPGDILTVFIDNITLEAEVKHVNNQFIGLIFINMDETDNLIIKEFITDNFKLIRRKR